MAKMNKNEIDRIRYGYYSENHIDARTLPLIVSHYIAVGANTWAKLTDEDIEAQYKQCKERDEQLKKENKVGLIAPEFNQYLNKACKALYLLPAEVRAKIIKENVV